MYVNVIFARLWLSSRQVTKQDAKQTCPMNSGLIINAYKSFRFYYSFLSAFGDFLRATLSNALTISSKQLVLIS